MSDREGLPSNTLADLFGGRPGWRLEPKSTPGAATVWCFVVRGKVEFSVTADAESIHLYEMETDRELTFENADALAAWLRIHREEALQEPAKRTPMKSRFRKFFEWS